MSQLKTRSTLISNLFGSPSPFSLPDDMIYEQANEILIKVYLAIMGSFLVKGNFDAFEIYGFIKFPVVNLQ